MTFTFDAPGNRELPHIMGQLQVLPKHWWEGKDAQGRQRDIAKTTLEPPLGSGPYRIKSFEPGRTIVYERVEDYWAKDLNVNVGNYNFDEIRFDEYRDAPCCWRPSRATSTTAGWRTRRRTGPPATIFRRASKARSSWRSSPTRRRASCRPSFRICGGRSSRIRACGSR